MTAPTALAGDRTAQRLVSSSSQSPSPSALAPGVRYVARTGTDRLLPVDGSTQAARTEPASRESSMVNVRAVGT